MASALSVVACKPAPRVQVLGDSTRLAEGRPSPRVSALFDGKRVHLRGARGETLGLSVRVSDGRRRRVRLLLPAAAAHVQGFQVHSLEVAQPSTAMYGPSSGPGRYPDRLEPTRGAVSTRSLAYFDVAIPRGAKPGRYRGRLEVSEQRLPVDLDVSSAHIDLSADPLVWVFYLPKDIAGAEGLPDDDAPKLLSREREYAALFRAHGAFLAASLEPKRFAPRRDFIRGSKYWPVAVDTSSDASIERDVHSWIELFHGTHVTPFAIPVDEPRTRADKLRARHIAEVMGRAGAGRPRLLRGVTDAWSPLYGDAFDVYFSPRNFPEPARARRSSGELFFTYNGRPPAAGSMILDTSGAALRTWGWIAQRYGIELWCAWEGLYFSDRYNGGGRTDVLRDPITFDERSRGGRDFGNGDGVLAYPGVLPSLRLKGLRRGLQDRLLLRELSACAGVARARSIVRRMIPRALGDAPARGPGSWSLEEPKWEQARFEVLDAIEQECHAQPLAE